MVKRKAECSPGFDPDVEEPDSEGGISNDPTNLEPKTLVTVPTGLEIPGETTSCHIPPLPATVAKDGGEVAEAFWSLLAAVGYQVR